MSRYSKEELNAAGKNLMTSWNAKLLDVEERHGGGVVFLGIENGEQFMSGLSEDQIAEYFPKASKKS